jgi:chloramphenicol 3-O phosphotransferase
MRRTNDRAGLKSQMDKGTVIILNGTSSSGKTSIVKALQEVLDEPYLDAGIDKFLFMLPKCYLNEPLWHQVFDYLYADPINRTGLSIKAGPVGHRVIAGMHRSIAALARAGNNVVADHVLLERPWLKECVEVLRGFRVWFVGVRCPLEVVEQRERERRDRTCGQARAQFDLVHAHGLYDLEVDTSISSPMDCALQIKRRMEDGPSPQAFHLLVEKLANDSVGQV